MIEEFRIQNSKFCAKLVCNTNTKSYVTKSLCYFLCATGDLQLFGHSLNYSFTGYEQSRAVYMRLPPAFFVSRLTTVGSISLILSRTPRSWNIWSNTKPKWWIFSENLHRIGDSAENLWTSVFGV